MYFLTMLCFLQAFHRSCKDSSKKMTGKVSYDVNLGFDKFIHYLKHLKVLILKKI